MFEKKFQLQTTKTHNKLNHIHFLFFYMQRQICNHTFVFIKKKINHNHHITH